MNSLQNLVSSHQHQQQLNLKVDRPDPYSVYPHLQNILCPVNQTFMLRTAPLHAHHHFLDPTDNESLDKLLKKLGAKYTLVLKTLLRVKQHELICRSQLIQLRKQLANPEITTEQRKLIHDFKLKYKTIDQQLDREEEEARKVAKKTEIQTQKSVLGKRPAEEPQVEESDTSRRQRVEPEDTVVPTWRAPNLKYTPNSPKSPNTKVNCQTPRVEAPSSTSPTRESSNVQPAEPVQKVQCLFKFINYPAKWLAEVKKIVNDQPKVQVKDQIFEFSLRATNQEKLEVDEILLKSDLKLIDGIYQPPQPAQKIQIQAPPPKKPETQLQQLQNNNQRQAQLVVQNSVQPKEKTIEKPAKNQQVSKQDPKKQEKSREETKKSEHRDQEQRQQPGSAGLLEELLMHPQLENLEKKLVQKLSEVPQFTLGENLFYKEVNKLWDMRK